MHNEDFVDTSVPKVNCVEHISENLSPRWQPRVARSSKVEHMEDFHFRPRALDYPECRVRTNLRKLKGTQCTHNTLGKQCSLVTRAFVPEWKRFQKFCLSLPKKVRESSMHVLSARGPITRLSWFSQDTMCSAFTVGSVSKGETWFVRMSRARSASFNKTLPGVSVSAHCAKRFFNFPFKPLVHTAIIVTRKHDRGLRVAISSRSDLQIHGQRATVFLWAKQLKH